MTLARQPNFCFQATGYAGRALSGDRDEPRHVDVERESNRAMLWLDPVRLAESDGFGRAEIRRVHSLA